MIDPILRPGIALPNRLSAARPLTLCPPSADPQEQFLASTPLPTDEKPPAPEMSTSSQVQAPKPTPTAGQPIPTQLALLDEAPVSSEMLHREAAYLIRNNHAGLEDRYLSPVVSAPYLDHSAIQFAASRGLDLSKIPQVNSLPDLGPILQSQVDRYFASPQGSQNPLKHELASRQTSRFLELIQQAVPQASPQTVYRLMSHNLALLALQDRAAAEITFGEHGVRHLVGHNIQVCESLLDQMQEKGVPVTAKDRLLMHQVMLLHDLGYAAENVRGSMAREGIRGQDFGHPLLAGRYVRERSQSDGDPLLALFTPQEMQWMHRCVMYHDQDRQGKAGIDLHLKPELSDEEKGWNFESITRLADNSHAFDDKLSDILYRHPAALKSMRMIRAARETDDAEATALLQGDLRQDLEARADLSADDKTALKMAVGFMDASEYEFSSRRLIGGKPELQIGDDGQVTVHVRQSPIHEKIAGLSGQGERKLLAGYVADLTGQRPQVDGRTQEINSPKVRFQIGHTSQLDEFQQKVESQVLQDLPFRIWAVQDASRSLKQASLEELLGQADSLDEATLMRQSQVFLESPPTGGAALRQALEGALTTLQGERREALHQLMQRVRA